MRQHDRLPRLFKTFKIWLRGSVEVTLVALLVASPTLARAQQPSVAIDSADTWYAQAYAQGERGFLVTHLWAKGPKLRSEIIIAGHRIATIVSGEYYYIIDEVMGTGAAIRRSPAAVAEDATRGRPFGHEVQQLIDMGAEKVGEENYGGMRCNQYRLTNSSGRRTGCAGVDPPHLPVRVETYNRSTGKTDLLSYVNWLAGFTLPDTFFEPDARIVLDRLEYSEYAERSRRGPVGPAPVIYGHLLHGSRK